MMDQMTSSTSATKRHRTRMVVAAAVAGAGLGIGGISLLGAPSDPVALQSVSLPSSEAPSGTVDDAAVPAGPVKGVGTDAAEGPTAATTGPEPPPDAAASGADGVVDRAAAEQAALSYLGEGRVTWVSQEDDNGAAWEIEVTLPDGREVDVYVDAAGQIVHTSGSAAVSGDGDRSPSSPEPKRDPGTPSPKASPEPRRDDRPVEPAAPSASHGGAGSSQPATAPAPPDAASSGAAGVVDRAAAERAALAALGEGRVTWVSQEDDYGAAWEIEVTLPDGREVDVYVDAAGQVVHTS